MLNLYRRRVRITMLKAHEEAQAHGWATTFDEKGEPTKHFFKADQPRFIQGVDNRFADTICVQFENKGIMPETLTIKSPDYTYTFTDLVAKRATRRKQAA